jgi:type I restriction enzyme S subunit
VTVSRYEHYKGSGVQWLGDVPSHWETKRVRRLFEIKKRIVGTLGFDVLSITQQGIKIKDTESNEGQISLDYSKYQLVEPGDFAMNHMDLLTGYVDISCTRGVTSPDYRVFTIKNSAQCFDRFFLYLLQTCYKTKIFYAFGQGASQLGRWRLPTDQFKDFVFPQPPAQEQMQIAAFLDRETARIDASVDEQKRLIELLKEKRQAVISRIVTKGLDPAAPFKDSGLVWLGRVPKHWDIKQLRHFAKVLRGKFTHRPRNDPAFYDGPFPFIQTGSITGTNKYITDFEQTLNERGAAVSKEFPRGTLVMAIAANIGDVAVLDFPAYFPDSIVGFFPSSKCYVMFLFYLMIAMKQPMMMTATISTQMNLNVDKIVSLSAACPPLEEQIAIAAFLDGETSNIDVLVNEADRAIVLLQERRSVLISAAVTGKIDVRKVVPSEAEAA